MLIDADSNKKVEITQKDYTKMILLKNRKKNAAVGFSILTMVIAIYFYSMYAVNQDPLEKMLEEAEEDE